VGLARILREAHIPFGVVTNVNLEQLKNYRAVLLPNVLEMTADQAAQFRRFVEAGSAVRDWTLVTRPIRQKRAALPAGGRFRGPLYRNRGRQADHRGRRLGRDLFRRSDAGSVALFVDLPDTERRGGWQADLAAERAELSRTDAESNDITGAEVLATITLPFAPPAQGRPIGSRFGAIHSNPPALTPGTDRGSCGIPSGKVRAYGWRLQLKAAARP